MSRNGKAKANTSSGAKKSSFISPQFMSTVAPKVGQGILVGAVVGGVLFALKAVKDFNSSTAKSGVSLPDELTTKNINSDPQLVEQLYYASRYMEVAPKLYMDMVKAFDTLISIYKAVANNKGAQLPPRVINNALRTTEIIKAIAGQYAALVQRWTPNNIDDLKLKDQETIEACMDILYEIAANYTYNIEMTYHEAMQRGLAL